jgi:putative transposase
MDRQTDAGKNPSPPNRKHPARGVHIHIGRPTIVFVTVCTKHREPWLARAEVHEGLVRAWSGAQAWLVGNYVILPDHIHLFCAPNDLQFSLQEWVTYWKREFTRLKVPGAGKWQRDCWDTRMRRGENYTEKWHYVRNNPARRGLVAKCEDWPYQGQLEVLRW